MPVHVHSILAESNSLHAQSSLLLHRAILLELDHPARAQHPVPGKGISRIDPE